MTPAERPRSPRRRGSATVGEGPVVPRATYRLQLNAGFTFRDATAIVPYLAALGVSHVYCSPYFRARSGSHSTLHGASSLRAIVARTPGCVAKITRPAARDGSGAGDAPRLAMR